LSADYSWQAPSPIGKLNIHAGLAFGVNWYEIKRDDLIAWTGSEIASGQIQDLPTTIEDAERRASGPGFRGSVSLGMSGPVWRDWPLQWSIFGSEGDEVVDLTVQSSTTTQSITIGRTKPVSSFGAGLRYDVNHSVSLDFNVVQRQDFYFSVIAGGPGQALGDGTSVDLRTALSTLYTFGLSYKF